MTEALHVYDSLGRWFGHGRQDAADAVTMYACVLDLSSGRGTHAECYDSDKGTERGWFSGLAPRSKWLLSSFIFRPCSGRPSQDDDDALHGLCVPRTESILNMFPTLLSFSIFFFIFSFHLESHRHRWKRPFWKENKLNKQRPAGYLL